MDPVSANDTNTPLRNYSFRGEAPILSTTDAGEKTESLSSEVNTNEIGIRADQSGEDIRPEAIARAQALMSDPNWLSDDALGALANKLISSEEL
tara:strand:+ start:403 stop:684 length:282 start_codon:yes stop_codon:yes gene_type:complete